jgi:DNA-binding Lrp family transcriptional regulator
MNEMKNLDYKIMLELVKNSKISDRELAQRIGVSQPTVTRRRTKLEKGGLLDYTAVPNFKKLGFEIMVISFSKWTREAFAEQVSEGEVARRIQKFLADHPNVIFGSTWGEGLGMNAVSISIHRNYSEYDRWLKDVEQEWGLYMTDFSRFIVSLKGDNIVRQITFKPCMEYIVEALTRNSSSSSEANHVG